MAQKTPTVRFKGFTDEWKQRKLEELGEIITGSTPSTLTQEYYSESGTPWVTPTDISDNITYTTSKYLSEIGCKVARIVPPETILVTCIASIGKNTILGTSGSFNQQINGLIPNKNENYPYFLFAESSLWSEKMRRSASVGTMQIVNKVEFSKLETTVPILEEQKKIGHFFNVFDSFISLQQRKLEKLKNIKKAMLEKMFPKKGSNVPEIRFAGFAGKWEKSEFSDVFITLQNNTLSRAELSFEEGNAINIHYGDILIKFGERLDISKEEVPFIKDCTYINKYQTSFLKNGDVIIADAAEDETVGKCSEILGLTTQVVISGLHTIPCRPIKDFANGYLGYYMNSNAYHDQLLPLMQGIKVSSISKSALCDTVLIYPQSIEEQSLIVKYLSNLNYLINHQQQKLEKLKNIKQACLEKMFV